MLHYQNVNEVSEATGDQTSEIPLTENHHGIGQNFMLPVRLPVLGLHGKKMPSFCHCRNLISESSDIFDHGYV